MLGSAKGAHPRTTKVGDFSHSRPERAGKTSIAHRLGANLQPDSFWPRARTRAAGRRSERDTGRAMSQENVEFVRAFYAALDRGDDSAWELLPPGFILDASRRLIDPEVVRGRDKARAYWD
ncbi:MAG: hypothetical protein QOK04_1697, partial [Solirubrobacteraceae bacterium]|nr:hypothetical protein [Solirubrobacteraceae bacterium]